MTTRPRRRRPFFKNRRRQQDGGEFPSRPQRKRRIPINQMKRGIFILPSLLTLTSIFFSFYSMIAAIKGDFLLAGALILVAGFFDGVDGKVARLTKTTTRFGLELDSLADVISFGVAPALLMYMWALQPYGRIGWVSAFVFVACGALRLARFNVQSGNIDPKRFNGLPIPAAAATVATTVLFFDRLELNPLNFTTALLVVTYAISFLMVSSVKFHAFKDLTVVKQKPFSSTVAFVLLLSLIAVEPRIFLFFFCAGYVVSGPILTLVLHSRNKKRLLESPPDATATDSSVPSIEQKPIN
jgi:CDP-diacylglycerol---serine O-phosphatidyltransferase